MKRAALSLVSGLTMAAFATACIAAKAQTMPPVDLSDSWTVVTLPDVPLALTVQGKDLWVAGAEELIAGSDDGGAHWTVRHLRPHGELLRAITFVDDKVGIALGTDNLRLRTSDGGNTWTPLKVTTGPIESWTLAAFADENNGIVAMGERFAVTHDAGVNWLERRLGPAGDRGPVQAPRQVGMLDANHALVVLPGNPNNSLPAGLIYTSDGGKTWRDNDQPPGRTLAGLRREGNSVWVYGADGDPGANAKPFAMVTHDGESWQPAESDTSFGPCVDTTCHVGGGWWEFTSDPPARWYVPQAGIYGPSVWAGAQGTYCEIEYHQLQCVKGSPQRIAGRAPQAEAPDVKPPTCELQCGSRAMPPRPAFVAQQRHFGPVRMMLIVDREGTVVDAGVMDAPWWDTANFVLTAARHWHFLPGTLEGKPVAMEWTYSLDVR